MTRPAAVAETICRDRLKFTLLQRGMVSPTAVVCGCDVPRPTQIFVAVKENSSACSGRSGDEVRVRFYFSLPQRRMVPPAVVVAATSSASDSILSCREGEWLRLQNATPHGCSDSGFHFGVKLGNRCKECSGLALLRAVILDFRG